MIKRQKKYYGVADHAIKLRKVKSHFLDDVDKIIDWRPISKFLDKKLQRKANVVGNPAYPALAMFKILLLQRWFNLSDPATEQNLLDRLSFIRFVDFSVEQEVPDETTICRFRNGLIRLGIFEKLLAMVNIQLEQQNKFVREGVVVDASVVASSHRPRKVVDVIPEDRNEDNTIEDKPETTSEYKVEVSYSDDKDAAWLRKGYQVHYGYKVHAAVDSNKGFILGGHTTPANKSDTGQFPHLIETTQIALGTAVFADKGYASSKNREFLKANGFQDKIMNKATRNNPLSKEQKEDNRKISKTRYIVEQAFGTMKGAYKFARARYKGIEKVNAEFHLIAMAYNIKKAVRMCLA